MCLTRGLRDALAGADRAGEGDGVDVRAVEHRLADDRALAHHEVEHALRQAGAMQDVDDRPGAARHEVGGLEHHGVAVGERRRDLPGRDGDREIPRRDDADDADRLARRSRRSMPGRTPGTHLAGEPQRLAGEEIEDLRGADRLADAFGERLAFLAGQQPAELLLAGEDLVGGLLQDLVALRGCRSATRPGTPPWRRRWRGRRRPSTARA